MKCERSTAAKPLTASSSSPNTVGLRAQAGSQGVDVHQVLVDHHVLVGQAVDHGPDLGVRAECGEHRGVLEAVVHRHEAAQLCTVLAQGQAGRAAEGPHRGAYVGGRRLATAYLRDARLERGELGAEGVVDLPQVQPGGLLRRV